MIIDARGLILLTVSDWPESSLAPTGNIISNILTLVNPLFNFFNSFFESFQFGFEGFIF